MNTPVTPRWLPQTPEHALGPTIHETILVAGRTFRIGRPDAVDPLTDYTVPAGAFAGGEYMPFWANLWPTARLLAQVVLREPLPTGLEALEIGCGLGLAGLAALARGLRVIFSDFDATALRFAADNARLNGFSDFRVLQMDFRWPPEDLQVPLLLASEVIYEIRMIQPLAALIRRVLAPNGLCLLTDHDRVPGDLLRQGLHAEGLQYEVEALHLDGDRSVQGTLYRITAVD